MKTYVIISRAPKFRRCGILFTQTHPRVVSEAEVTPEILAEPMLHVVELDGRASEPSGDGMSVQVRSHGHSGEGVSSGSGKAGPHRSKRSISRRGRRGKSEEVSS